MIYNAIIDNLIENADKDYTKPERIADANLRTNMINLKESMRKTAQLFENLVENSLKRIPNTKLVFSNPSGTRYLDGSAAKIRNYLWIQLKEERWKENSISISIFATKEFFRITTEFVDKDVTTEEKDKYNKIFDTPLNGSEFDYFFPKENRYCTYNEVIEKNKEYKFQISKSIKRNEILSDEQLEAKIAESILFLTPIYQGILAGKVPIVTNSTPQNLAMKQTNQPQDKQGTEMMQKILFGAPGTGKSFKIDDSEKGYGLKDISDNRKFRTTFHPDYDYAQFVGAYKPVNTAKAQTLLNKDDLLLKLNNLQASGETYPVQKFGTLYYESIDKLSSQDKIELIREAGFDDSIRTAELPKGTAIGKFIDKKKKSSSIMYSFVPQVFAKAYVRAWSLFIDADNKSTPENQVYLVIEEINRGNCAQIFGDIFQLLDRDNKGFSQYSIDAGCDFATWLKEESVLKEVWPDYVNKVGEGKLKLPSNLNILATMNTSDQSLFPMDSAFKRRFDWEYVPIKYAQDDDCGENWDADEFKIVIGNSEYKWLDFLKKVNTDIYEVTRSEDKQMGEFFIKPKDGTKILFKDFRSKVLFYLWDSVYKDETERQTVFHFPYGDGDDKIKSVTFQSLFGENAEEIVNTIMEKLKVEKVATT